MLAANTCEYYSRLTSTQPRGIIRKVRPVGYTVRIPTHGPVKLPVSPLANKEPVLVLKATIFPERNFHFGPRADVYANHHLGLAPPQTGSSKALANRIRLVSARSTWGLRLPVVSIEGVLFD